MHSDGYGVAIDAELRVDGATLVVEPEVAVEPALVIVVMTAVLLLLQVTWLVMYCCCALPLKVPKAVKTTVCPAADWEWWC